MCKHRGLKAIHMPKMHMHRKHMQTVHRHKMHVHMKHGWQCTHACSCTQSNVHALLLGFILYDQKLWILKKKSSTSVKIVLFKKEETSKFKARARYSRLHAIQPSDLVLSEKML